MIQPRHEAVEQRLTRTQTSVVQRIPIHNEAIEPSFPHTQTSVKQWFSIPTEAAKRRIPYTTSEAVNDDFPPLIDENARTMGPSVNEMVVTEPPLLAEGMSSSSVSDVPVSRIGSRRKKRRK
ncbi:unnamed protein product [Peronospora belbahrii]|uniref:Uncharacterized protein n=1 Tax=Peronospora belbahrii TaxID=622444 RepID=A0ABN8CMX5_9STRA|nr:unnamed protein product [Peronospora belbahrii]